MYSVTWNQVKYVAASALATGLVVVVKLPKLMYQTHFKAMTFFFGPKYFSRWNCQYSFERQARIERWAVPFLVSPSLKGECDQMVYAFSLVLEKSLFQWFRDDSISIYVRQSNLQLLTIHIFKFWLFRHNSHHLQNTLWIQRAAHEKEVIQCDTW